jgi:hypothetical protein
MEKIKGVQIFEQIVENKKGQKGKIAFLVGGLNTPNPKAHMDEAVRQYVGSNGHNQFIEIHLDNPWTRVVTSGLNDFDFDPFADQKIKSGL